MTGLRIIEMDHIVLNVRDVERSLGFYTQVLGLKGERIEEFRSGKVGFPSVRINGDTLIDLTKSATAEASNRTPNLNHFCFVAESTDLAALTQRLRGQGVPIVHEPVSRWGAHGQATSIYILDPDGNEIEIRCY